AGEIPAGTPVVASIYLSHTDPERYSEPFAFRPERFLEGPPADLATWLPFGGGVRRCLGAAFATLEMREGLRTVVGGSELGAGSEAMEKPKRRAVTLMPRHGTRTVVVSVDDDYVRPTRSRTSSGSPSSPVTNGPKSA